MEQQQYGHSYGGLFYGYGDRRIHGDGNDYLYASERVLYDDNDGGEPVTAAYQRYFDDVRWADDDAK